MKLPLKIVRANHDVERPYFICEAGEYVEFVELERAFKALVRVLEAAKEISNMICLTFEGSAVDELNSAITAADRALKGTDNAPL